MTAAPLKARTSFFGVGSDEAIARDVCGAFHDDGGHATTANRVSTVISALRILQHRDHGRCAACLARVSFE
jgi:hypothetical protein